MSVVAKESGETFITLDFNEARTLHEGGVELFIYSKEGVFTKLYSSEQIAQAIVDYDVVVQVLIK